MTSESSQSLARAARRTKESTEGHAFIVEGLETLREDEVVRGGEGNIVRGREGVVIIIGEGVVIRGEGNIRGGNIIDALLTSELGRRVWKILNGSEERLEAVKGNDAR